MLGHSKEIISADIYGDTQEIIEDCLYAIEPFIEAVMPKNGKGEYYDYSNMEEIEILAKEYLRAAWWCKRFGAIKKYEWGKQKIEFVTFDTIIISQQPIL